MSETREKIALACDHRGYDMKKEIAALLGRLNFAVEDCGCYSTESADYPEYMFKAGELVGRGLCSRAIGICYTGIGSSIAANKIKGVRASLVKTEEEAKLTRAHNDSNMLILGAGFLKTDIALDIVKIWLQTPFEGGRHAERVNQIKSYENQHSC